MVKMASWKTDSFFTTLMESVWDEIFTKDWCHNFKTILRHISTYQELLKTIFTQSLFSELYRQQQQQISSQSPDRQTDNVVQSSMSLDGETYVQPRALIGCTEQFCYLLNWAGRAGTSSWQAGGSGLREAPSGLGLTDCVGPSVWGSSPRSTARSESVRLSVRLYRPVAAWPSQPPPAPPTQNCCHACARAPRLRYNCCFFARNVGS